MSSQLCSTLAVQRRSTFSDLAVSLLMALVYLLVLLRISPWLLLAAVALAGHHRLAENP